MKNQKRILTGDRTTGRLHLGHYVGSLVNRVKLQTEYDTLILLADVQALTTHFNNPTLIRDSIYEVLIDNLSVGLDPNKVTFIQQSEVTAIAELTVFYSMLVTVNSLRHNPTIKSEAKQYGYGDLTYGFLGYPVSQAADMTFCNADLVPVGDDQLPHMEQARKIVHRFNDLYGKGEIIIKTPESLLSQTPRLAGLDGNSKMGKSLGNAIYLSDDEQTVKTKIMSAVTDANRISLSDKGNPDICSVYGYQKTFNPSESNNICNMCKEAKIGCVACKKMLSSKINELLNPIREKRLFYSNKKDELKDILISGTKRANTIGGEMMDTVKCAMNIKL